MSSNAIACNMAVGGDVVLVFTKYPDAGYAKTRLIPLLGAERAAAVSRSLTERCLNTVRAYASESSLTSVVVHYATRSGSDPGAQAARMQEWIGAPDGEWLVAQSHGDLGRRLAEAFRQAFEGGASRVVVVGTDIPEIDATLMREAFKQLNDSDTVIGPARDGGYYLLGMRKENAGVFNGVNWSTGTVFEDTKRNIERLGLRYSALRVLRDIDLPEDVAYFESVCGCKV
jgi:uncharacterized protein